LGSGTKIIAAEITGRSCHAIELLPQYVDVALERWQAFTGATGRGWRRMERHSRPAGDRATNPRRAAGCGARGAKTKRK
jgi:hypothetical protein